MAWPHGARGVAPQLAPRGRCPCRRRGTPNRGAATAPSCPRRRRPMAPPRPWSSGTCPRTVWRTEVMAVEVGRRGLPSMAPAGLSQGRTGFNLGWTVNEIPSTRWASRSYRIEVLRPRSTRIAAGRERPLRLPLAPGRPRGVLPPATTRCSAYHAARPRKAVASLPQGSLVKEESVQMLLARRKRRACMETGGEPAPVHLGHHPAGAPR